MERIFTSKQIKLADAHTINDLKISEKTLIERVGNAVAEGIKEKFSRGKVLVCIGKGNNGEDGKVVADNLSAAGFSVSRFFAENACISAVSGVVYRHKSSILCPGVCSIP